MARLKQEVYVFTFGSGRKASRTALRSGIGLVRLPHVGVPGPYPIPSLRGIAYIAEFLKEEKPDIVHCQPLFSPLSLVFMAFQRVAGHRIVGSLITGGRRIWRILEDRNSYSSKLGFKYWLVKLVTEKYVVPKTSLFFALNDGWKDLIVRLFGIRRQKVSIVPLGAECELFRFDADARIRLRHILGVSRSDVVVVISGSVVPEKGTHLLVEAMAPIVKRSHRVKLLIIGEGESPYIRYLQNMTLAFNMQDNVIFHPSVHRTKLPEYFSACDIAVWPGAPSISMIEAASSALPLIVERSPFTSFIIEYGNGLSFKHGNLGELRNCLDVLIHDSKLRRQMGRKSRLLVEKKLDWGIIAAQVLNEYTRVLE